jgi:pyruvate dehydrogenase (quinone)
MKVAEFLVERLLEWDVHRIYGFSGDAINPILAALDKNKESISYVQARHEEMAAFMACAHAKFTGEVGVCLATSGPGAIHLLNGLYDAKLDNQPVLAIVGQQTRIALGTDFMQEVDLANLFKDVAGDFVHVAMVPEQVRHLIDRSMRIAKSQRSVTCLIIPVDVQKEDAKPSPKREHGQTFTGVGYSSPHVVPKNVDLEKAADVLNAGEKVAMLIGAGCLNATDEVITTAETLQAGVAKALLGKAALSDELPFVTGAIGLLGTKASWDLMQNCDTLFMIGTSFPYAEFLPKEGKARGVQIDLQAQNVSLRYPMEVNLIGDARETLTELLPMLKQKERGEWREKVENSVQDWWKTVESLAGADVVENINPQLFFWHLNSHLPDDAILIPDCGTTTVWLARDIKIRRGMMSSTSGGLATMGCAMPYAIAAKFAWPTRPVFAFVGDGAMQMNGLNELVTVAKHWRDWDNPALTIVVLNNHDLSFVTWEQRGMVGMPKFEAAEDVPQFRYDEFARSLGLNGIRLDSKDQLESAWSQALRSDKPTVIDLLVDPNLPPLPPHISKKEAQAFVQAMKADPERDAAFFNTMKQMAHSIFPGW